MREELTLYTNPKSRGRIARWMLEELGTPYHTEIVDYGPPMQTPEFLQLNPMGKIPVIRHGDTIVTEAAAICAYLADTFPEAELCPRPHERGAYYRWLFFAAGPLESATVNQYLGVTPNAEQEMRVGYRNFKTTIDTLEYATSQAPYIAGERFTAADVYIGSSLYWGMQYNIIEPRKALTQYCERLRARKAWVQAEKVDAELAG